MAEQPLGPVRLAIRAEGEWLNAYIAQTDTMEGAFLIGSIARSICDVRTDIFTEWKDVMTKVFEHGLSSVTGFRDIPMVERRAPEHERSGSA